MPKHSPPIVDWSSVLRTATVTALFLRCGPAACLVTAHSKSHAGQVAGQRPRLLGPSVLVVSPSPKGNPADNLVSGTSDNVPFPIHSHFGYLAGMASMSRSPSWSPLRHEARYPTRYGASQGRPTECPNREPTTIVRPRLHGGGSPAERSEDPSVSQGCTTSQGMSQPRLYVTYVIC